MRRPVRPASRPVSVTRRTSGDTSQIIVRAGDRDLGAIAGLGSGDGDGLEGRFTNYPAYVDFTDAFRDYAEAVEKGDAALIAAKFDALQKLGVEVWHKVHDMRIDRPGSLTISGGRARFKPNDAFLMMRTGGL
jgi:hypothetical protein